MNYSSLASLLERFSREARRNGGHVTLEQFAVLLELPISDAMKAMFDLYDRVRDMFDFTTS